MAVGILALLYSPTIPSSVLGGFTQWYSGSHEVPRIILKSLWSEKVQKLNLWPTCLGSLWLGSNLSSYSPLSYNAPGFISESRIPLSATLSVIHDSYMQNMGFSLLRNLSHKLNFLHQILLTSLFYIFSNTFWNQNKNSIINYLR